VIISWTCCVVEVSVATIVVNTSKACSNYSMCR
jgi:hypothetical protein